MGNVGAEDSARRDALRRLVEWITQFSGPEEALAAAGQGLEFTESRTIGGAWALDALWNRLGVGPSVRRLLAGSDLDDSTERVLFALVANRALAPSALVAAGWVSEDVFIDGLPATTDDMCCRAADWLLEIGDSLEQEIFDQVAGLKGQDVEVLFFGVTAVCSGGDHDGRPVGLGEGAWGTPRDPGAGDRRAAALIRAYGKHADHREYPPQAVIGMAVTHEGIPARTWCWRGTTAEPTMISQVQDDLRDRAPSRIIWVSGHGLTPPENRRRLRGSGDYIIAEKLRSGSAEAAAALSSQGRYQAITAALRVKEVRVSDDERFIVCHDPGRAVRDAAARARTLALLKELIEYTDTLSKDNRAEACAAVAARPGLHRYLRITPAGRLRVHAKSVKSEENLDGKYLLRASAPDVAAEDIAMTYTRLLETERGWRAMHQAAGLRPVCRCGEKHIRAHVLLCSLALLLSRIAENACHAAWPELRRELDRIAIGTFTGPVGTFRQRTEITDAQRDIFARLGIDLPPRMCQLTPTADP